MQAEKSFLISAQFNYISQKFCRMKTLSKLARLAKCKNPIIHAYKMAILTKWKNVCLTLKLKLKTKLKMKIHNKYKKENHLFYYAE